MPSDQGWETTQWARSHGREIHQGGVPVIRYLSLGAGVQSSALLVLAALGQRRCPRADFAVFADTQDEPRWVYQQLEALERWGAAHNFPIVRVTAGRLADINGHGKRGVILPVFTIGNDGREAMLTRQCTNNYKLKPIHRYLRSFLGYKPRQVIPRGLVESLIGLSFDERIRMKESQVGWIQTRWPLIDAAITRSGCVQILEEHGLPVPNKSACYYCPFHDDAYWRLLREREPDSFEEACHLDDRIRNKGFRRERLDGPSSSVYIHRSLIPLRDVTFDAPAPVFDFGFNNECSGHCGV